MDDATRRASERLDHLSERIKLAAAIIAGLLVGLIVWLTVMYVLVWTRVDGPID